MTDAKEAGGVENVVAVVIPCYKVGHRVLEVIAAIGPTASMQIGPASAQALALRQATQEISERLGARRLESD